MTHTMTNIYIQFTEDGQYIRYWSREPFEEGVEYGEVEGQQQQQKTNGGYTDDQIKRMNNRATVILCGRSY